MFNLYYLNYTKAFEIAMQIDNKILEKQVKEMGKEKAGEGTAALELPESPLNKLLLKLSGKVSFSASKSDKTEDTLKVVSTKSTILAPVIQESVEIRKLGESRIGKLLKIKDVSLDVVNYQDMIGTKIMLSGLLKNVPIEGMGAMDLTTIVDTVLKGASYIIVGQIPEKVSLEATDKSNKLLFKIPMQMDNEMENGYSVSDLEIGPVTVVGIYRGVFNLNDIKNQVDVLAKIASFGTQEHTTYNQEIETDIANSEHQKIDKVAESELVHYIDVIAIIQELC